VDGDSRGRWEGDTLVIDAKQYSTIRRGSIGPGISQRCAALVERYTMISPDHILYEATITDPKVFSRPWKMTMPLYRRTEKNVKLLEYECVFYLQEQRYGRVK